MRLAGHGSEQQTDGERRACLAQQTRPRAAHPATCLTAAAATVRVAAGLVRGRGDHTLGCVRTGTANNPGNSGGGPADSRSRVLGVGYIGQQSGSIGVGLPIRSAPPTQLISDR